MMQFFIHLRTVADCLLNFVLNGLSKLPAQAMNCNFHRPFVYIQLASSFSLRSVFDVAGKPRFERFEIIDFAAPFVFLSKLTKRAVQQRQRPSSLELAFGTWCGGISQLKSR